MTDIIQHTAGGKTRRIPEIVWRNYYQMLGPFRMADVARAWSSKIQRERIAEIFESGEDAA